MSTVLRFVQTATVAFVSEWTREDATQLLTSTGLFNAEAVANLSDAELAQKIVDIANEQQINSVYEALVADAGDPNMDDLDTDDWTAKVVNA